MLLAHAYFSVKTSSQNNSKLTVSSAGSCQNRKDGTSTLFCFVMSTFWNVSHENLPSYFVTIDESNFQNNLYKAYSHVHTILFFIGYPRSRHSLLGSLLDAHPHMVVSDESMAFPRWKGILKWRKNVSVYQFYDTLFRDSKRAVTQGRRSRVQIGSVVNKTSEYGYHVPHQWQGNYDQHIEVRRFAKTHNYSIFFSLDIKNNQTLSSSILKIDKQFHMKVLFNSFHLNVHNIVLPTDLKVRTTLYSIITSTTWKYTIAFIWIVTHWGFIHRLTWKS